MTPVTSGYAPTAFLFASAEYIGSICPQADGFGFVAPASSLFCLSFTQFLLRQATAFNNKETESDATCFLLNAKQQTDWKEGIIVESLEHKMNSNVALLGVYFTDSTVHLSADFEATAV